MRVSRLIETVAKEAQGKLDGMFKTVGTPEPGSALDQYGLRDGEEIILDYLRHNEWGVAFEHLIYMITETDIELTVSAYEQLVQAGEMMGLPPELWSTIRCAKDQ